MKPLRNFVQTTTLILTLTLAACVDTTGLTGTLTRVPHPKSNPNGAVIVVEFADLQCPACRSAHEAIVQPLLEEKGSQIRYEFHHFPLRSLHRFALDAAEAAECAGDQGKFWEFVDMDYTHQDKLNKSTLTKWAEELKLDRELFGRCTASHIKRDAIMEEYAAGQEAGVRGTPTFFVGGERSESDLQVIRAAIEQKIKSTEERL